MGDIYPMWAAAHGVMIVTPVNWYQASSPLKFMMDRLVCADGGNSDPTLTSGKDAKKAKEIQLKSWDYPKHSAGRIFSVVVHGDVEGAENVRRAISDWLCFMDLSPAGPLAEIDRYIGYFKPYAISQTNQTTSGPGRGAQRGKNAPTGYHDEARRQIRRCRARAAGTASEIALLRTHRRNSSDL